MNDKSKSCWLLQVRQTTQCSKYSAFPFHAYLLFSEAQPDTTFCVHAHSSMKIYRINLE